jgi:predicted nuclease with TOPRIM domain
MADSTQDFETRREAAQQEINEETSAVEREISRLRSKRGRLKGQSAPDAQIDGLDRRIETLKERKEALEGENPTDRVDEPDPTPKSFHSL